MRTPTASYQVDGYDRLTNTVYEFHGCLFHGCPRCFPKRSQKGHVHYGRTMEQVYEATREKEDKLRQAGYTLRVQWGCEWEMWLKRDPTLKQFVKELELIEPLDAREAFFGGRSNAVSLYTRVNPDRREMWSWMICVIAATNLAFNVGLIFNKW